MKIENGEKLLFIGDSVTDDNRARPVGEGNNAALGNGFVRLIDAYLAAEYPERNIHVVNMGVSGNTSRDLVGWCCASASTTSGGSLIRPVSRKGRFLWTNIGKI